MNDVIQLVDKELEDANKKFPLFRSPHEGYAVLMEEFDELGEDVDRLANDLNTLWTRVRANSPAGNITTTIYNAAVLAAVEAIQVAAMAKKYHESSKEWE